MLKKPRGLARLASVVVVGSLILLATAVDASGAMDPTLSVSPTTATPGETVHYSGTGWTDCGTVTITLNTGAPIAVNNPVSGAISGSFAAPAPTGAYTLIATPTSNTPSCSPQQATFSVVAPPGPPSLIVTLAGSPVSALPGQTLEFEGGGWETCGAVRVALGTTTIATFPAGSTAIFGRFTAPSTLGVHTLTATGTSATSSCQVTAAFDVRAAPTLSVSPTTATAGETIHYSGTMRDCGPVTAALGTTTIATFPAGDITGSFAAPSTLGVHTLTAAGATGQADHASEFINLALCGAAAQFDVVAGTTPPEVSGEPEAGTAPVSATPLHVTG